MLKEQFKYELEKEKLFIGNNDYTSILKLYQENIYFEKVNNRISKIQDVIDDIEDIPSFTDKEHKHFLSIYNKDNILVGCIDIIEGYTYGNINLKGIWIGLLEIANIFHHQQYGTIIVNALKKAINDYDIIQIGVLKNNEIALKFWIKNKFVINNDYNSDSLYLMEYIK